MAKKNKAIVNGVDSFSVSILDNGYTLEYTGNNSDNDWTTNKVIVGDVDKLCELIRGVTALPQA
jgi:hypothetical protein